MNGAAISNTDWEPVSTMKSVKGDGLNPIVGVSWNGSQKLFARLNEIKAGLGASPPTEAQWEYACRAGTNGARYGLIDDIAWYAGNRASLN